MNEKIGRRYVISGRVQGVGFRYFAQRAARELGIAGWAQNLDDGRVEVEAVGPKSKLDEFESRLRKGPVGSDVREFEVWEKWPNDISGFQIR
jgi:acylphosphatase